MKTSTLFPFVRTSLLLTLVAAAPLPAQDLTDTGELISAMAREDLAVLGVEEFLAHRPQEAEALRKLLDERANVTRGRLNEISTGIEVKQNEIDITKTEKDLADDQERAEDKRLLELRQRTEEREKRLLESVREALEAELEFLQAQRDLMNAQLEGFAAQEQLEESVDALDGAIMSRNPTEILNAREHTAELLGVALSAQEEVADREQRAAERRRSFVRRQLQVLEARAELLEARAEGE